MLIAQHQGLRQNTGNLLPYHFQTVTKFMNKEPLSRKIQRDWQAVHRMTDEIDQLFKANNIPGLLKTSQKRQRKIEEFFAYIEKQGSSDVGDVRNYIADDIEYIRSQHQKIQQALEQKQQELLNEQKQLTLRSKALKAYQADN